MEEEVEPQQPWLIVAPGVIVRESEYEERFAGLDLAALQERMGNDLFVAFVRSLGTISGSGDLDVEAISQIPDIR